MSFSPAFRRLWAANIFTNLADGLGKTAFPLLAVTLTHDPVLISVVGGLVMLPWLLFAIPIGAIIDTVDRRLALAFANALRMAIIALLSVLISVHHITIYWLYVVIFVVGICEVIADTTSQTVIPTIVDGKELERANSRLEMTFTVFQDFIGAPIGGLLYAVAIAAPFIANSLGFLVATVICLTIPLQFNRTVRTEEKSKRAHFIDDVKFGMSHLWNHAQLRRIVLTSTIIAFCNAFANSTSILYLIDDLGLQPKKYGFLMTAFGAFALVGAYVAPKTAERFGRGLTLATAITVCSINIVLVGLVPNVWWFLVPYLITAFFLVHWNILLMATYQRLIPKDLFGRIHGTRRTLIWGMMPIAAFIGGFVAKVNLRLPWFIGGAVATVTTLVSWNFIKHLGDSAVTVDE